MNKTGLGNVRIIAGKLRGSKLPVLQQIGLRPTANRVRETLFNWLQHSIQGCNVLDLFAGSGALGFEAASRMALQVTMLESNFEVYKQLEASKNRLSIENVNIIHADSMAWLENTQKKDFDLIFLDPPFDSHHWPVIWPLLLPKITSNALLYIEISSSQALQFPAGMVVLKQGKTVQSHFFLLQWQNVSID